MSLHKQREAERPNERGKSACVQLKLSLAAMFGCTYYSASMVLGKRVLPAMFANFNVVDTIYGHTRNSLHMRTRLSALFRDVAEVALENDNYIHRKLAMRAS
jgi:hypothetical protein